MQRWRVVIAVSLFMVGGTLLAGAWLYAQSSPDLSTDTRSSQFASREERLEFLSRYLDFQTPMLDASYHIVYHDNSSGFLPGPSDWNIQVVLQVDKGDVEKWKLSLPRDETADLSWGYVLAAEAGWTLSSTPSVFAAGGELVALFDEGFVFRRSSTLEPL
jgi:hypothetical protein